MSATVLHAEPHPHRCGLSIDRIDLALGSVVRCDECGAIHKLVEGDCGNRWRRLWFQRLAARRYVSRDGER